MNKILWEPLVKAKNNGDFISIKSYSGYANANLADRNAPEFLLEENISHEMLGKAIIESLKNSKPLSREEHRQTALNLGENYKAWIQRMMEKYGYKTKRALFKNMKNCYILCQDEMIVIEPTYHDKTILPRKT